LVSFLIHVEALYEKSNINILINLYEGMEIETPLELIQRDLELTEVISNFARFLRYCGYAIIVEVICLIFILNPRKKYVEPSFDLSKTPKTINE
jgi:hypothetical protein